MNAEPSPIAGEGLYQTIFKLPIQVELTGGNPSRPTNAWSYIFLEHTFLGASVNHRDVRPPNVLRAARNVTANRFWVLDASGAKKSVNRRLSALVSLVRLGRELLS